MKKSQRYFIKTFGCAQNVADSQRIAGYLEQQGMKPAKNIASAGYIVINTCMIRESAENRVYGLVNNLFKEKGPTSPRLRGVNKRKRVKVVLIGCMVGMAVRDKSGKFLARLKEIMPAVDEFLPIEEIGFNYPQFHKDKDIAYVVISNGCNNFCTYCVVPYSRGREISRPYEDIIKECKELKQKGYKKIMLLGQNVNSYGADLILNSKIKTNNSKPQLKTKNFENLRIKNLKLNENYKLKIENYSHKPIYVKHLGRYRIPTIFPYLLDDIAKFEFDEVSFMSSNPWDFSNELIEVIAKNKNISRTLHIAVQSGDDEILKKMNRWYTAQQFVALISKLKTQISNLKITTDIIVGFCGETEKQFQNTVRLCKKIKFDWAYISIYSQRPMTGATQAFTDDVPHSEKRRRWKILDDLINKPKLMKNEKCKM